MSGIRYLFLIYISFCFWTGLLSMSLEDRITMREKVREMFMHGYMSYKNHAYPADELMPLSCRGRHRYTHVSRGDVDDALGNFSLTMIDTLDSLFLFNELDEFEFAVKSVTRGVSFNSDVDVSVFETNIRVLGGLLGGHVAALLVQKTNQSRMQWYRDELLHMAVDIGNRLLPAFNTSTGIPFPRVNLKYGNRGLKKQEENTCTACAGTMILEFAALSRLTGNPVYEEKAVRALSYLWKQRSRYSDLVGRVINVQSGEWIRRESGIGAGIDSYYEYLFKAYVLLGETVYLHRFHTHYSAVKRYVSGPHSAAFPFLFLDVNMHQPSERVRTFMDALFAFWPGLQVLSGDVKPAIALHEFLFQVHKRNKLLPEAFTPDLNVYWGEHLLRPEFIESTYLLYQATGDPYYLDVGVQIVNDLEQYARVPCGYAAIQDVRTMKHIDRFDSFVLAETFKYLYLLFSDPSELPLPLNEYVLTTEAHLLPLSLSRIRTSTNEKTIVSSVTSHVDNLTSSTSFSDKFGDRDRAAEADLYRRGRCPDVNLEHFRSSTSSCTNHSNVTTPSPSTKTDCETFEGPGLHRNKLLWLQWFSGRPGRLYCPRLPNKKHWWRHIDLIRQPLRQLASGGKIVTNIGGANRLDSIDVPLRAAEFRPDDKAQLALLRRMGIELNTNSDGRLVVRHDQNAAESQTLGIAGLLFVHELLSLVRARQEAEESVVQPRHVVVLDPPYFGRLRFPSLPAHFGRFPGESGTDQKDGKPKTDSIDDSAASNDEDVVAPGTSETWQPVVAPLRIALPTDGCSEIEAEGFAYPSVPSDWNLPSVSETFKDQAYARDPVTAASRGPMTGAIGVVRRGGCLFVQKARNLAKAGAVAGIVMDYESDSSAARSTLFAMSGEDDPSKNDIDLPFTLLFAAERDQLIAHMRRRWIQTQQPTMAMVTKEFNASHAFLSSLSLFAAKLQPELSQSSASRSLFNIRCWLTSPDPRAARSFDRIGTGIGLASGGLSIIKLPGVPMSCLASAGPDQCSSDVVQVTGTQWLISLYVDKEQVSDFMSASNGSHVTKWISGFEHALSSEMFSERCRGLLLSLFEASLQTISTLAGDKTPGITNVSSYWISEINRCLNYLKDLATFKSTFGMNQGRHNTVESRKAVFVPVSLSLSFSPAFHPVSQKNS